jgi:hypothetical protein
MILKLIMNHFSKIKRRHSKIRDNEGMIKEGQARGMLVVDKHSNTSNNKKINLLEGSNSNSLNINLK